MLTVKEGLIHAIADCKTCGKRWDGYHTAKKRALSHARRTGHTVILDLGYAVEYSTQKGKAT